MERCVVYRSDGCSEQLIRHYMIWDTGTVTFIWYGYEGWLLHMSHARVGVLNY